MAERKPDELLVGLAAQGGARRFVQSGPRCLEQLAVEGRQPLDERLSLRPPHAAGHDIELARDAVEQIVEPGVEGARSPAPKSDASAPAPCAPAATARDGPAALAVGGSATRRGHPGRATPLVERIENVGFTEIDPDRPTARTLGVVPLEISIDSATGHLERHAPRLPGRHEVERRPGDPNQVPVILLAEVALDLAAVVYWFRSHTILSP